MLYVQADRSKSLPCTLVGDKVAIIPKGQDQNVDSIKSSVTEARSSENDAMYPKHAIKKKSKKLDPQLRREKLVI